MKDKSCMKTFTAGLLEAGSNKKFWFKRTGTEIMLNSLSSLPCYTTKHDCRKTDDNVIWISIPKVCNDYEIANMHQITHTA